MDMDVKYEDARSLKLQKSLQKPKVSAAWVVLKVVKYNQESWCMQLHYICMVRGLWVSGLYPEALFKSLNVYWLRKELQVPGRPNNLW